jgi:hypothetical protein
VLLIVTDRLIIYWKGFRQIDQKELACGGTFDGPKPVTTAGFDQ